MFSIRGKFLPLPQASLATASLAAGITPSGSRGSPRRISGRSSEFTRQNSGCKEHFISLLRPSMQRGTPHHGATSLGDSRDSLQTGQQSWRSRERWALLHGGWQKLAVTFNLWPHWTDIQPWGLRPPSLADFVQICKAGGDLPLSSWSCNHPSRGTQKDSKVQCPKQNGVCTLSTLTFLTSHWRSQKSFHLPDR